MIKLYDTSGFGYIETEVADFYSNDLPAYFARTGKGTYLHSLDAPIYFVPDMLNGSKPRDGGHLILSPEERDELIKREPAAEKWIRPFMGSLEFIRGKKRFCLWLEDCPPNELRKMPLVYKRVQAVRDFRLNSKRTGTRKVADIPWLFAERRQPKTEYLIVPCVSGDRREYVPIGWIDADTVASDLVLTISDAMYWHFGVLTSLPHMAWMRMVCGRLGVSYRYSAQIVYNNFPWPPFSREVERTASAILMARKNYPDATFADLYDPLIMPRDLRRAHAENDRAVMEAYDFPKNFTENQMYVAFMDMYQRLANLAELTAQQR